METLRMRLKAVVVVGCLLSLCGITPSDADSKECKVDFQEPSYVQLCHPPSTSPSTSPEDHVCPKNGQGFVLEELVIAPLSRYEECSTFHLNYLQDAQCLGKKLGLVDEYNSLEFDLLDTISMQHKISSSTVVGRFPVEAGNSSFIAFKETCRPADPELSQDEDTVVNICSNVTVKDWHVYLTLPNTTHRPDVPSMCRCVVQPTTQTGVNALDVRLQNADRRCGSTSLQIKTKDPEDSKEIECEGMSALYGFHKLYSNNGMGEFELILKSVDTSNFPTRVWIELEGDYADDKTPINVSCEAFIPLTSGPPGTTGHDDNGDNDDSDTEDDEEEGGGSEAGSGGLDMGVGLGGGFFFLVILVIIAVIIIKRRRSGLPCVCSCRNGGTEQKPYNSVPQNEPVYSEPGKPRPSTSIPYTFPVDARVPESDVYAEPDPKVQGGSFSRSHSATTPPPLPDSPPPGSPPATWQTFTVENPLPKPERTLLRPRKESSKSNTEEEYDHINSSGKVALKSPTGRDVQNNNIGQNGKEAGGGIAEENVYNRLDHGDDYSQMGATTRLQVKDNVYDTTS